MVSFYGPMLSKQKQWAKNIMSRCVGSGACDVNIAEASVPVRVLRLPLLDVMNTYCSANLSTTSNPLSVPEATYKFSSSFSTPSLVLCVPVLRSRKRSRRSWGRSCSSTSSTA